MKKSRKMPTYVCHRGYPISGSSGSHLGVPGRFTEKSLKDFDYETSRVQFFAEIFYGSTKCSLKNQGPAD